MTNKPFDDIRLSPEGNRRRAEMLATLQQEVVKARRRKASRSIALGGAAMIVCIFAAIWAGQSTLPDSHEMVDKSPTVSDKIGNAVVNEEPENDSGVREAIVLRQVSLETINDDELLETLSSLGQPATIGHIGGQPVVVPQTRL